MLKYLSFINLYKIPIAPLIFGLSGTLPFILLSIAIWICSYELKLMALYNLINYSIIILSFVGAIHWGAAMIREDTNYKWYFISIIPALLSWFLIMGFIANYLLIFIILMILFLSMFFIDIRAVRNKILPHWYLPLRKIITIIVFLSLGSVCLAININVI
tara:strand:+ start:4784 stop:5263 length:480 start_codon:yes stop_codon:yes gene_type:complete